MLQTLWALRTSSILLGSCCTILKASVIEIPSLTRLINTLIKQHLHWLLTNTPSWSWSTSGLMLTVDTGSSFTLDQHLDQPSINTWLTLDCTQLTLDGHSMDGHLDQHSLDQNLIDTQLTLNWHSINSQLMVGSVDWLNQQSVACLWKLVYCWSNVDWVSI